MAFGAPGMPEHSKASPPDLGSFPLDRQGTCREIMTEYLKCLKSHKSDSHACRSLSKRYLECRMENGLMTKEPMEKMGFSGEQESR